MDESDYPTPESDLRRDRDRLSELPDSLILEILSLLVMKDAVRTTVLSKRWKDLWTTVPCLDFDNSFRNVVDEALAKWNGAKILKFSIGFWDDHPPTADILDSWLLVPIEKQVEDLFLHVGTQMDGEYCPPQRLYSCSSIAKLYLSFCNLKIEENVQWYQLKSLTIEYPTSFLSQDAMNRILSGAPLLEELVLWTLDIYENFNIRSTSLKNLEIGRNECSCARTVVMAMLRICCPNLLSLEISGCVYGTCLLEEVPSLTNATLCFEDSCVARDEYMVEEDFPPLEMFDKIFRSISHAEKVTLSNLSIQLLLKMKENNMVVQFSNAKFLKLYVAEGAKGMLDVIGMFPELKMLVVELDEDRRYNFDEGPHIATVDASYLLASQMTFPNNLKTVEIFWSMSHASIFPMVEVLLENAHMLEKMVLRLRNCGTSTSIWAKKKVLSMRRSSPTAQVKISKIW